MQIKNQGIDFAIALRLSALPEVLHTSFNTGTRDLPDMHAQAYVTTTKYTLFKSLLALFISTKLMSGYVESGDCICSFFQNYSTTLQDEYENQFAQ